MLTWDYQWDDRPRLGPQSGGIERSASLLFSRDGKPEYRVPFGDNRGFAAAGVAKDVLFMFFLVAPSPC
jgi:hypothetical protein